MSRSTEQKLTEAVLGRINTGNRRVEQVLTSLVTHLHDFIREVELTEEELDLAVDFLTRTGKACDDRRQEFILLADMIGVTMLVDAINHRLSSGATETTVTGPFHAKSAARENGAVIAGGPEWNRGGQTFLRGRVTDIEGRPIAGATVDLWQADDRGHYDSQDEKQPEGNLRAILTTDGEGRYWCRTIKPSSYPVPTDGPVGELLQACGRHPMRPAHIHFVIKAAGYRTLITHVFVAGDEYLDSDAAFAVKDSLIAEFVENRSEETAARHGFSVPFYEVDFDFVLPRH